MHKKRKSMSALIAISLLLIVSVLSIAFLKDWFVLFKDEVSVELEKNDINSLEIDSVDENYIIINNEIGLNVLLEKIKFNEDECDINDVELTEGINVVDIGLCGQNVEDLGTIDVVLVTDMGVKSETEIIRDIIRTSLVVKYEFGACDFSRGYVRLMGMSDFDLGHAEIGSSNQYTYSVCIRHLDYTVYANSDGSSDSEVVVYLLNQANSHAFTNTGSVYQAPSQWYNSTLSTDSGTISTVVSSSSPGSNYTCIYSLDLDNTYGSHVGDCSSSSLPDKFWVTIS
jgi:hypothetical protein